MTNEIFKKFTTEEIKGVNSCDFAFYGWEGDGSFSYWNYMTSYKEAAEIIYEKMTKAENHAVVDSLVYPFCFLHRHHMELGLKYFYNKYMNSDDNSKHELNHNLQSLWDNMESTLKKMLKDLGQM